MDILGEFVLPLVPPLLVGVVFWVMMRGILRADSKERQVYAQMEAKMREAQGKPAKAPAAAKKPQKVTKKTQN